MIDTAEQELLAEVLRGTLGHPEGVNRVRFRRDHYHHIKVLDGLQRRGLLGRDRDGQAYRLPLATLALLDSPKAKDLLADMACMFEFLRRAYLDNL